MMGSANNDDRQSGESASSGGFGDRDGDGDGDRGVAQEMVQNLDVVATLRHQNYELRDKLRQATAVLSEVAAERAAVGGAGAAGPDHHTQSNHQTTAHHKQLVEELAAVYRELRATRDQLRLEASARASGALAARAEADVSRGRLQEEAEASQAAALTAIAVAEARSEAAEKREECAERAAAAAEARAVTAESCFAAAEAKSAALGLTLADAERKLAASAEAAEDARVEVRAMAMWDHGDRDRDADNSSRSDDEDIAVTLAAAAEAEGLLVRGVEGLDTAEGVPLAALDIHSPPPPPRNGDRLDRPSHSLVLAARRTVMDASMRCEELTALRAALTGELAAARRADDEIARLRSRAKEAEADAVIARGSLAAERTRLAPSTSPAGCRLHDAEAELTACRTIAASLGTRLERERQLRVGLQLAADAGEVWGEHSRVAEGRCAELAADVGRLDKVIAHLNRRLEHRRGGGLGPEGEADAGCARVGMETRLSTTGRGVSGAVVAAADGGGRGGRGWARAAAFGVELSDPRSVLFFCFKFWQQLSRIPPNFDAPSTPPTPNPLLFRHVGGSPGGEFGSECAFRFGAGGAAAFSAAQGHDVSRQLPPPVSHMRAQNPTSTLPRPAIAAAAAYYRHQGSVAVAAMPP
jgi:hypothetical protein